MTTTTEPATHYSPAAANGSLAGDIHGTLACGAEHWQVVTDKAGLVTCEPCKAAAPAVAMLAAAQAARAKTSANNPLNRHLDALAAAVSAALDLAIVWRATAEDLDKRAGRISGDAAAVILSTRAQACDDHAVSLRKALA